MKPKLWNGPSAVGEARARFNATIDTPYQTASGPGFQADKKQGFHEVFLTSDEEKREDEAYLVGIYLSDESGESIQFERLNPEDRVFEKMKRGAIYDTTGDGVSGIFPGAMTYIGDGYLLQVLNDGEEFADQRSTIHYPVLWFAEGTRKSQVLASSLTGPARRHVLLGPQMTGTWRGFLHHSICHTGFIDAEKRYGWVFAFMQDNALIKAPNKDHNDPNNWAPYSSYPVVYCGNTGQMSNAGQVLPNYPGRYHFVSAVQSTGPGKLMLFIGIQEDNEEIFDPDSGDAGEWDYSGGAQRPQLPPYLLVSTNHGESWAVASAEFIAPYLWTAPSDITPAGRIGAYMNSQIDLIASGFTATYVGNGVTLIWILGGWDADVGEFCPMLFRYANGSFTRLPWPADTWYHNKFIETTAWKDCYVNFVFHGNKELRPLISVNAGRANKWCFGVGCAFFVVVDKFNGPQFLFTRDFGATWTLSAYVTSFDLPSATLSLGDNAAVVSPYKSPEAPGKIVFLVTDIANDKIYTMHCDGNFDSFKFKKSRKAFDGAMKTLVGSYQFLAAYNRLICYVGNKTTHPPYVVAGLPKQYD